MGFITSHFHEKLYTLGDDVWIEEEGWIEEKNEIMGIGR